jgi:outer membrane receptor protein involved in Fe transport
MYKLMSLSHCLPIFKLNLIAWSLFSLFSTAFSATAAGDEDFELGDLSLGDLLNIEVTSASKIATKIAQAPAVITAYKQSHLEEYGFTVINDLLYTLPGFGPSQDYDRPTVATRGNFDSWSNNHILHLIDGVPMNDNLYGSAYTWLMPVFFTNTMEVIRGPGSALYGSNATNGIVQMHTYDGADLEDPIYAKISLYGSEDTRRYEFMTGTTVDDYDFIVAYSYHNTDGNEYLSYDGSNRLATLSDPQTNRPRAQKFKTRDDRDDSYLWAKLSIGDSWQLQYHRQTWDFNTGHGWVFWIPDFNEKMSESRDILSLKYNSDISENLSQEYVVRYQKHDISWNQRYYPNQAFAGFYPSGMWEFLDTDASDVFVRAQFTWLLGDKATVLAGFEGDRFSYTGDNEHFSNIDVDVTLAPFEGDVNQPLGPWLDFIADEPIINTAFYAQLTTGDWMDSVEATFGIRWDKLAVDYKEVFTEGQPKNDKQWSKVSPRVALVWSVTDNLVLKGLWGKAFRAPTPTEMGGAHTFSLASNISELEPELITTSELVLDWTIDENHVLRANYFSTKFDNQIAYSTANFNLSTNVYSTENSGLELELIGNYGSWNWFANASYVSRDDETILAFDGAGTPEFTEHGDDLKWEPDVKINAGLAWHVNDFTLSSTLHYHAGVERRDNEKGNPGGWLPLGVDVPLDYNLDDHRPRSLDSWISVNAKGSYAINENFSLHIEAKNLFDESASLVKTGPFAFDYQIAERHVMIYFEVKM